MRPVDLWFVISALALATACGTSDKDTEDTEPVDEPCTDFDEDNVCVEDGDCDDENELVYPGAGDIPYNGRDEDCDGSDLTDVDGDGYDGGDDGDDCNDSNPAVYPGAPEDCYVNIDYDCDGLPLDGEVNYDCDNDGYERTEDCDDEDENAFPGNEETWYDGVDGDCDGWSDYDQDLDGDDSDEYGGQDCDDEDPLTSGSNGEIWDGTDRNCDDEIDNLNSREMAITWTGSGGVDDYNLGNATTFLDDMDGDGLAELAVGDMGHNEDYSGIVYVLTPSTVYEDPTAKAYEYAVASIASDDSGEAFGWQVERVQDYDGDGLADLLVTSPFFTMVSGDIGQSFVYSSKDLAAGGEMAYSDYHMAMRGEGYAGFYGHSMGDLNGDGYEEIGVSTLHLTYAAAFVYDGAEIADGGYLRSEEASALLYASSKYTWGGDIAGQTDIDGDGSPDVLLGGYQYADDNFQVYLLPGTELADSASLDIDDYDYIATSDGVYDETSTVTAGIELAPLGDIDGDGYDDFAVSETWGADALDTWGIGNVYVISTADWSAGEDVSELAWLTLEGAGSGGLMLVDGGVGDYDGDGADDLLISDPGYQDLYTAKIGGTGASGKAAVYYLPNDTVVAGGTIFPEEERQSIFEAVNSGIGFGAAIASGDVNGDGDDDIFLGAPLDGTGSSFLYLSYLYEIDTWQDESTGDTGDTGDTDTGSR